MKSGKLLWITGLSGSGKTTIASMVYRKIVKNFPNTIFIDGDTVRKEILGDHYDYDLEDRKKVAYRTSKLCEILTSQNMNVICATISLFHEIHDLNKRNIKNYYEIFINVDIEELVKRDSKGLYAKAKKGEINNVVGVDLPFDMPKSPFMIIENTTSDVSINEKSNDIIKRVGLY